MTKSIESVLAKRPVDRRVVNDHKKRMLDEVRAYRLRELREALNLTQVELADLLNVSQNRVSRLEHGDLERTPTQGDDPVVRRPAPPLPRQRQPGSCLRGCRQEASESRAWAQPRCPSYRVARALPRARFHAGLPRRDERTCAAPSRRRRER